LDWILINEQSNINLIFVSLPFEFFQKRGPHKVGDANKFIPRCALNFEEHGVRYAGLDRSAVGSRKYFTAPALSKGIGLRFQYSGLLYDFITTSTAGLHRSSNACSSRRSAAGFRLVQKMAAPNKETEENRNLSAVRLFVLER
jgi:hypothetical protein